MRNNAQQKQELELWQMTGTSKRGNMRVVRQNSGMRRENGTAIRSRADGRMASERSRTEPRRMTGYVPRQGTQRQRTLSVNLPERNTMRGRRASSYPPERSMLVQRRVASYSSERNTQRRATDRRACVSKRRQARRRRMRRLAVLSMMILIVGIFLTGRFLYGKLGIPALSQREEEMPAADSDASLMEETPSDARIREDFLSISEYNRPGTELSKVNNIFVHYTANPKTSAAQNRSYFESLGQTHERAASAHFIIGYDGEIIQCIPLEEEAYAVIGRNSDSISIECCYISEDGAFTQETYDSLIWLLASLTERYDLGAKDILRHYDCGGKLCPLYYVEHEDAWQKLLSDVEAYQPETAEALSK